MKTAEEIRVRAKSVLKHSFRHYENGNKTLAERNEARYDALCWVLGIVGTEEDDALWEEAQVEYEQTKEQDHETD
jgi:hypothetical protein